MISEVVFLGIKDHKWNLPFTFQNPMNLILSPKIEVEWTKYLRDLANFCRRN